MRQVTTVEVVALKDGRQVVRQRRVPPPHTCGTTAQPIRCLRNRAECWSGRDIGRFVRKLFFQVVLQYPLAEVIEGVAENRAPCESDLRVGLPAVPVRPLAGFCVEQNAGLAGELLQERRYLFVHRQQEAEDIGIGERSEELL